MMLTVRQVASRVGLSEWAIRRAIHDGELPAYKPRGQIRVQTADLEDWLHGTRVIPVPASHTQPRPTMTPSPSYPQGGSFRSRVRRKEAS